MTILLFPFANALVKLSGLIIREDPVEDEEEEEPEEKAFPRSSRIAPIVRGRGIFNPTIT